MKKIIATCLAFVLVLASFAQSQKNESVEQEIKKLSKDWMVAAMERDTKTLNNILAPEFKLGGTNPDNPVISRDVWMKNTMENLKIDSTNYSKIRVDVVDNVAIVQSTFYWSVSFMTMAPKKDTVDLIDTWIKRGQTWQVVSRLVVDK